MFTLRGAALGALLTALCASPAVAHTPSAAPASEVRIDQDIRCLVSFAEARTKLTRDADRHGSDLASLYLLGRLRTALSPQQITERLAAHRRSLTEADRKGPLPLCLDQLIEVSEMGAVAQVLIDRAQKE